MASGSAMLMPIPMAAASARLGSIAASLFAEPTVNLSSGSGSAIMAGENDLTAVIIERGTAVYTKSVPDLSAAIEVRTGAP